MPDRRFTTVVFDFGGVLITPITRVIGEVAAWHGVTMHRMLDVLMGPIERSTHDHPWHRCERGEISIAELQAEVAPWAAAAGIALRGDEYARVLRGDFSVHDDVIARIERLRAEGFHVGLLTNSFLEFREIIAARIDLRLFDTVVDSSEVGHRKPEPEIYELTTARTGAAPSEIVYLDDFLPNVDGARRAGWTTIHVRDVETALHDLDVLLTP
ncbi:MAG: HAD family hydrolase [Ilumatobacteraceae bacterium]